MQACACAGPVLGPGPAPTPCPDPSYPDLDFWILQINVPLSQHVAVGSRLHEEALHLDEIRLCQAVTVLLIKDSEGNALLCRGVEGRALMRAESRLHLFCGISTRHRAEQVSRRADPRLPPDPALAPLFP